MDQTVSRWRGRIELALALQNKQERVWSQSIDLYNCKFFDKQYGAYDPERVDVHFANWYVSNLIPLVYFRDPYIFVKPRNDKYSAFAETCEDVVNYLWKELYLKQQFKKVILSAFLTPPGWMKIGYMGKPGQDVADMEEYKKKSIIKKFKDAILGKISQKEETPLAEQGIVNELIKEDSIFANWIPSFNILLPPGYNTIYTMPWMVEIEDCPLIDFKRNPFYKNRDKAKATREISEKDQRTSHLQKPSYVDMTSGGPDDDLSIIRLYHIWDRRSGKRLTISDNELHFEGEWPYDMEGFPFEPLIFEETIPQPNESNVYPTNALTPIMPQIFEQSNARTMMAKHRRRANVYILVPETFTEEQIGQIEENESVQVIRVPLTSTPIASGTIPALPPDVYNVDELIKQDLQSATNMGQLMFAAQKGTRTATQAQLGQSGLQLKASARVDVVEDYTVRIARKLLQLAYQFCDRDKVSEIIGKEVTPDMWPDLPQDKKERRRIIQAELQVKIDAGSAAPPKDETVDRKQILDLASIVSTVAPERINKGEFVKQLLKRFKFAKDLDSIVIGSDEEEKACAELENQLMLKGAPQAVSPNQNHQIHIAVHSQVQGNPIIDEHIIEHGKRMGIMPSGGGGGGGGAQQGDIRPPIQSTNPEQVRKGIPTQGSEYQATQNKGVGSVQTGRAM